MATARARRKPRKQEKSRSEQARIRIMRGESVDEVCRQTGLKPVSVRKVIRQLAERGISRDMEVLSVSQAAYVLGLSDRRTRTLCSEGRLGYRVGQRSYAIPREDLVRFAALDRPSGYHGWQKHKVGAEQ